MPAEPSHRGIARVEPLTRTRAVRGPFDYRLPADLVGGGPTAVAAGTLLRVRFAGRPAVAVVTSVAEASELPADRLADAEAILPVSLPGDLVTLAAWMADDLCSTPSRALSLMLPPGATTGTGPRRQTVATLTAAGRAALAAPATRLTAHQRKTLARLTADGPAPVAALGGADHARRLAARGLITLAERSITHRPAELPAGAAAAVAPPLTGEQRDALDVVLAALGRREGTLLLQGVTGSGKTEVYLGAVEAALAAGRTAIVLVPEIALTPQSLARFRARLGDIVAVLHSALSEAERRDEWWRLRRGEARVCVGPRSAVFAPLADLGLIVVDEEHESSYKHEGDPRYDARRVAWRRARAHGAVLLAGTATPRPESVHSLTRIRLSERVDGRPLPAVRVLDMRETHHPLHPETRMALADVRAAGSKAILLLNRRGWSNFLSCRACGTVWMCPDCDVALVLHLAARTVTCHHCGHRERVPERCRACGSSTVARHGAGTERIEHDLRAALGEDGFPVFRLDAEATRERDRAAATLRAFREAPAGILVGTQVVAKGHDFPDVSLGVVLDADQTLRFPDFRAEERTFQLVTQLAGRAGRGGPGDGVAAGEVLVQTTAPDARAIRFAARHDADGFLTDELARRRLLRYPPFSTLIRVVCSAVEAADATAAAAALRREIGDGVAQVLGPAPLFRLRGRHRSQLVLKAERRTAAVAATGAAVDAVVRARRHPGVAISVDVDPQ